MKKNFFFFAFISLFFNHAVAQNISESTTAKQANNPLASIKSISLHNVFTPSVYASEGTLNTTWIRYARPIGRILIRASMPINTINLDHHKSGLGDFNIFGTYILSDSKSENQIGIGPILTIPTATSSILGTSKWQLGAAFAGYFASSNIFQYGVLATWQHSVFGDSDREKIHIATLQPFFMWQLGKGAYLRSSAINIFDFEKSNYMIPFGLGIGKIVKVENTIFNLFIEPQFTAWHHGSTLPETNLFIGINTQF